MRYLKILSLLIFLVNFSLAQKQEFHFPKYALQFEVVDLLKFKSYFGNVVSIKYHFNDSYALCLGVNTKYYSTKVNEKSYQNDVNQADSLTTKGENKAHNKQIGMNLIALKYFSIARPIKFYAGSGLFISRSWENNSNSSWNAYLNHNSKRDKTTLSLGLEFLYGVEWFFHSQMSLNMDYGLNFSYYIYKFNDRKTSQENQNENESKAKQDYKRTSWSVNPLSIRLGLTVYL